MSEHTANIHWQRGAVPFTDGRYSRRHRWAFDGGAEITASASPYVVREPMSDPAAVDPEEAFVAAISSCHMLWFLSIAANRGLVVDRYDDEAAGLMSEDERGRMAITRVILKPIVSYSGGAPEVDVESHMHEEAHAACYIANSLRTEIVVEPKR